MGMYVCIGNDEGLGGKLLAAHTCRAPTLFPAAAACPTAPSRRVPAHPNQSFSIKKPATVEFVV
jgi:hypothetical protein